MVKTPAKCCTPKRTAILKPRPTQICEIVHTHCGNKHAFGQIFSAPGGLAPVNYNIPAPTHAEWGDPLTPQAWAGRGAWPHAPINLQCRLSDHRVPTLCTENFYQYAPAIGPKR